MYDVVKLCQALSLLLPLSNFLHFLVHFQLNVTIFFVQLIFSRQLLMCCASCVMSCLCLLFHGVILIFDGAQNVLLL